MNGPSDLQVSRALAHFWLNNSGKDIIEKYGHEKALKAFLMYCQVKQPKSMSQAVENFRSELVQWENSGRKYSIYEVDNGSA